MSSSTAAAGVAASPAVDNNTSSSTDTSSKSNSRRRPMVVKERSLRTNVVENGTANGAAEDKMVVSGNGLMHTIRGEPVVERTKDFSRLKKGLSASPGMTSRQKKPVTKHEKAKWQTVLSVLTKNCLLLAVLLWLGQNVWRWTYSIGDNSNSPFAVLDYEERVAEVEASLKKTAKMLQVQLDVVDKKIGSEMGVVTKELSKKLTEKAALLEKELKRLESKIDSVDSSVDELKEMGLISRQEFERQWNELKNRNTSDGNERNLNLDQIRAFARSIVEKEIEKHAADGLGRVDYAVASGGARVVRHSEPYVTGKGNTWFSAAKISNGVHANAHKMLEPSFGEPGQCFPLQGSSGEIGSKNPNPSRRRRSRNFPRDRSKLKSLDQVISGGGGDMALVSRFLSRSSRKLYAGQVLLQNEHVFSVRSYAKEAAPSNLPPLKGDEMLKSIFYEVKNKFDIAFGVLRKEKITIDPDDQAAVSQYAKVIKMIREKADLLSESQKIKYTIEQQTQGIPDARTYFLTLREIRIKSGMADDLGAEAMMLEVLDKVEKEIKAPLLRSDKKNMGLLMAEFEKINKKLGIRKEDLLKYEEDLELEIAKEDLQEMKKDALEAMETQLKREEFKDEQMVDVKSLDIRNFMSS